MTILLHLLFGVTMAIGLGAVQSRQNATFFKSSRSLTDQIITKGCSSFPSQHFQARLDMYYLYLVDFNSTTPVDLNQINLAVAIAVASDLSMCDTLNHPLFAVDFSPNEHQFSDGDGTCQNLLDGIECRVVRGLTSILLNGDITEAENITSTAIATTLADTEYLRQYASSNLVRSDFVRRIGEDLVVLGTDGGSGSVVSSGTARVAVAAAVVSFVVTAIVFYGVYRSNKAEAIRSMKQRILHYQARRRHFFENLQEEQDLEPGWMRTEPQTLPSPSITWSVSDLTSDSQSIKSSLPLDRIVEEGPPSDDDVEVPSNDILSTPDKAFLDADVADFISRWNDPLASPEALAGIEVSSTTLENRCTVSPIQDVAPDETPVYSNHIEDYDTTLEQVGLRGCQYLDESSELACSRDDAIEFANMYTADQDWGDYSTRAGDFSLNLSAESAVRITAPAVKDYVLWVWLMKLWSDLERACAQKRLTYSTQS